MSPMGLKLFHVHDEWFCVVQGDPVWAISRTTISEILNLSINFFFVLPLANMG
jgi:hypothetical protein